MEPQIIKFNRHGLKLFLYCGIDYQGEAIEWSRVNRHPYLYLHFLELSLLVIIL
jgi:hypothetical protein